MIPLLLASVALAGPSIPHETFELPNGLDVILAPDASDPIVAVNVWYHVGSADEQPGLTGFAHLFEHLMFQGSPSSQGEFFTPLEAVGAKINGSTTPDRTNYYEVVPAEHLPLALFLESDRMGWLLETVDQQMLDNQREVVRNERRQRYETQPYGTAWMDLHAALYPEGHPYHHPTIGSHEDLENAKLEDVQAFFRTHYPPNHASLVVAGAFDPAAVKKLVTTYFGDIPASGPVAPPAPEPVQLRETVEVRKYEEVPQQRVWIAWPTPAAFQPGDAELTMIADVLSGGRESRLDQALVHQGKIASSVTAFVNSGRYGSTLVVAATAAPGHTTDEIVDVVEAAVAELATAKAPTPAEIEAARSQYERGAYAAITTVLGKADLLNHYNLMLGTPDGLAQDLARFEGRTPDELQAAAERWLAGPHVELHILPKDLAPVAKEPAPVAKERPGFWKRLFGKEAAPKTPAENDR